MPSSNYTYLHRTTCHEYSLSNQIGLPKFYFKA